MLKRPTALLWILSLLVLFLMPPRVNAGEAPGQPAAAAKTAEASRQPNLIFVLTDDQRFDALGCMGNESISTPHLDALASRGALFRNMFCTTSICAVSRATFLTGQYERRHGVTGFAQPLSDSQFAASFPGLLRKHGYRTGMVGKWGLGGPLPREQYDVFHGYSGQGRYFPKGKSGVPGEHQTHRLGDQAVEFLSSCTAKQPFLLQLYTKAAHCQDGDPWPFQPDPRYQELYSGITIPPPPASAATDFQQLPEFLRTSEARIRWQIRFATPEMYQKSVKDYYRLVTGVDDVMGRFVAALKENGQLENTVIVFTSDNGFYLGEHGLAGKWYMHEESIRLPLIITDFRLPAEDRGRQVEELVLSTDIAPTLLDLAGIDSPSAMQGRSLVPLLRGEHPTDWRTDFLYEHRFVHKRIPKTEGVRTERWKYTRYTSVEPLYEELFNLEQDPHEQHNLADDPRHEAQLKQLRSRWRALAAQAE
ncbi:MAG: sulfatase [Planctomycetaceae bacterium]|nr:sulfatase [Planctomycetaceae bacterium]